MNELQLQSRQQPGEISIDNFQELRDALEGALTRYRGVVYTKEMLPAAKTDKKELSRLRREIDDRRKEIKRVYLAPYNDFESRVKELLALVDAPLDEIKLFISSMETEEKKAKKDEIEAYFRRKSGVLDTMAQQVWESPSFFDMRWLNKSTSAKMWQKEVDDKIAMAGRDIQSIRSTAGQHTSALTARYLETLSLEGLSEYRNQLTEASKAENAQLKVASQDQRLGSKILNISGNPEALIQAIEVLNLLGLDCEVLEDDAPQPMPELTVPDFNSFVAFDLETSGTYGASNGDIPAEITEIGAVRVVNGEITDKFSTLVNPGRKILPHITRITGITNEMVADQPDVLTAIRQFADFAGNDILIGHNIKTSDLYYVDSAARRAGVRIENPFFDTYCFARKLKDAQGWENIKLEYLAERLGVQQSDAHRAWCDAEATAEMYFKMQSLYLG